MTDVNGVLQIEMRGQSRQVICIVVHVVAFAWLGGPAMPAPIMGNDAIAMIEEEHHLRVPVICRERPPMAEHDRLTFAPVLVEDFRAVFGLDDTHLDAS